jgi:uncharacterized protein (TIGR02996 family)
MVTDANFLDKLLADPKDDTTRLVYADWLEEKGDSESNAKAQFLRLTAELVGPSSRKNRKKRRNRLQQLAATLDTYWLAVVSRLAVENCDGRQDEAEIGRFRFRLRCHRKWEDLSSTDTRAVRFCGDCRQNVHYCDTIMEAREHAWAGHCIAVDLGVIRRKHDLQNRSMVLGRVGPDFWQREEERMQPDAVSAERIRQKQARDGSEAARIDE